MLHECYAKSHYMNIENEKCLSECYMNAVRKVTQEIKNKKCLGKCKCYMNAATKVIIEIENTKCLCEYVT
jgi:hypothetical protein